MVVPEVAVTTNGDCQMVRLARTTDGTAWIGDTTGFVPLAAADPTLTDTTDALRVAPGELPDPGDASAGPVRPEHLDFGMPLPTHALNKLWGIGLNYVDHATDLGEQRPDEPASFLKPTTTARGPGGPIRLPPREISDRVTAEGELGVVIGRTCTNVPLDAVDDVIAGFVPIIDMTAEDILQRNPRFLTRAKSFDTFLIAGPWIRTPDGIDDLADITVRTVVNEEVRAENEIENMLFPPRELVAFHSEVMTLNPGDIISTGTPGASEITPGDAVRAEIDRIGTVEADVVR